MEKHWPTLCALILTLAALVHFETAAASHPDAASRGTSLLHPRSLQVEIWMCAFGFHSLTFYLFALFLPVTRTKPGYCPRVLKVIPLHKGCVCDDDCPGNHKCCSVERRDVCVPPAFSTCPCLELLPLRVWMKLKSLVLLLLSLLPDPAANSSAASEKAGLCPRARWGSGVCAEHCYDDSDCPGKEKCCSSGCGHQCTAPYTGLACRQISRLQPRAGQMF